MFYSVSTIINGTILEKKMRGWGQGEHILPIVGTKFMVEGVTPLYTTRFELPARPTTCLTENIYIHVGSVQRSLPYHGGFMPRKAQQLEIFRLQRNGGILARVTPGHYKKRPQK